MVVCVIGNLSVLHCFKLTVFNYFMEIICVEGTGNGVLAGVFNLAIRAIVLVCNGDAARNAFSMHKLGAMQSLFSHIRVANADDVCGQMYADKCMRVMYADDVYARMYADNVYGRRYADECMRTNVCAIALPVSFNILISFASQE